MLLALTCIEFYNFHAHRIASIGLVFSFFIIFFLRYLCYMRQTPYSLLLLFRCNSLIVFLCLLFALHCYRFSTFAFFSCFAFFALHRYCFSRFSGCSFAGCILWLSFTTYYVQRVLFALRNIVFLLYFHFDLIRWHRKKPCLLDVSLSFSSRKVYFLIDFIWSHLCASLDSEIGRCHQSQTWRYLGATVSGRSFPNRQVCITT